MGKYINITIRSTGETTIEEGNDPTIPITEVVVTPATVSVDEGSTTQLTATIIPDNATNQTGVWSSSDTDKATVDQNGLVTGILDGLVTITFTANDRGFNDSCDVTVENPPIPVTGVTVTPSTYDLTLGETTQLTKDIIPSNAVDQTGVWSSDDTDIATVDSNGLVTSVAYGGVTITYTTNDGSYTDTCEVSVLTQLAPVLDSAVLNGANYVLNFSLPTYALTPIGGYDTFIDDVDQNDRDSYSGFTRTISGLDVEEDHTFKLECRYINAVPPVFPQSNEILVEAETPAGVSVTSVSVSPATSDLENTRTLQLTKVVSPSDASDKSGTWSSDTEANVTVDSNGLCSGLADSGTATITFTTTDGSFTDTCVVTCIPYEVSDVKAFPTANGGGSNATGGRGGQVIHVDTLVDGGTGSFREAIEDYTGARIIVFDVSGTIEILLSNGTISIPSDVTIAGQTAPEGGITIVSPLIQTSGSNIIIRYVKFRHNLPDSSWGGDDALDFLNCSNVILDHCSFSWGGDEIVTFRGTSEDITIQNCLIAEGKTGSIFGDSNNTSINYRMSYLRNMHYNVPHRHPNANSDDRQDIINNVVFNWKNRLSVVEGTNKINHISNYYTMGALSSVADGIANVGMQLVAESAQEIYTTGNILDKEGTILLSKTDDPWDYAGNIDEVQPYTNQLCLFQDRGDGWSSYLDWTEENGKKGIYQPISPTAFTDLKKATPHSDLVNTPSIIEADVLIAALDDDCGANASLNADGSVTVGHDALDTVYVDGIVAGTGVSYTASSGGHNFHTTDHWSTFWASVSTTAINKRPAGYYKEEKSSHIPEVWFDANMSPGDSHNDIGPNDYTWLEEFLNQVDE